MSSNEPMHTNRSPSRVRPPRPAPEASHTGLLVVDDDPAAIQIMGRVLGALGAVRFATNGADALRLAREVLPDVILLDAEMPGMSGFELLRTLKADALLATAPVIIVTSHTTPAFEVTALQLGAADFISKPCRPAVVLARVQTQLRVKKTGDDLRNAAGTDGLTGVANRRTFDEIIEQEWQRARRAGTPLSLLMVDVDHFKLFNDGYGHPAGDACLKDVAHALLAACRRPSDRVARYGGEEFAVLLPQTPRAGAQHMARKCLDAVWDLCIPHATSPTGGSVSASIGVACFDESSPAWPAAFGVPATSSAGSTVSAKDLLLAADAALYSAKQAGRNRSILREVGAVHPA